MNPLITKALASNPEVRPPTFVRASDGKYYQDLVYQDHPLRRGWFLCFDADEPAEFVLRVSEYQAGVSARDVLSHRGFDLCVRAIVNGRKDPHHRFFGCDEKGMPMQGATAISWFLIFRKGVPLPTPNKYDSCVEIYPFFPNKVGVYFGDKS